MSSDGDVTDYDSDVNDFVSDEQLPRLFAKVTTAAHEEQHDLVPAEQQTRDRAIEIIGRYCTTPTRRKMKCLEQFIDHLTLDVEHPTRVHLETFFSSAASDVENLVKQVQDDSHHTLPTILRCRTPPDNLQHAGVDI